MYNTGDENWKRLDTENEENWINITGLEYGAMMEIRVVAVNGIGEITSSDLETILIGQKNGKQCIKFT